MPLIEIANAHLLRVSLPLPYYYYYYHHHQQHVKDSSNNKINWNYSFGNNNFNVQRPRRPRFPLLIKAVAAAPPPPPPPLNPQLDLSEEEEEEKPLDEREKLRRSRISKANKGNTPWNKGRKHSPETLQKIKERTRIAMQNPKVMSFKRGILKIKINNKKLEEGIRHSSSIVQGKTLGNRKTVFSSTVKMKLTNLGHAQTTETKLKIGAGVRKLWEKRRGMKMVQETCFFEWQNLIAEASRQGLVGQEDLQWNSYETLAEQLKQEWSVSLEERKQMARPRLSNRAPKSLEQRRKIAEAIAAKWADPDYREKVCSGLAKYHSTEKRPRTRPSYGAQSTKKKKPIKKRDSDTSILVKSDSKILKPVLLRQSKSPAYKDPLMNSKLEMIKNIRALRASVDTRQTQAIQQARLLIAEAEKAAKALEVAAVKSPVAQSSLTATRKLIAEAIQSLESIDAQKMDDCSVPSVSLSEVNKENESAFEVQHHLQMTQVNGHTALSSTDYKFSEDFGELSLERPVNGVPELHLTNGCASLQFSSNGQINQYSPSNRQSETEQDEISKDETNHSPTMVGSQSLEDETLSRSSIATKKWVRGRFVEVSEEKQ